MTLSHSCVAAGVLSESNTVSGFITRADTAQLVVKALFSKKTDGKVCRAAPLACDSTCLMAAVSLPCAYGSTPRVVCVVCVWFLCVIPCLFCVLLTCVSSLLVADVFPAAALCRFYLLLTRPRHGVQLSPSACRSHESQVEQSI